MDIERWLPIPGYEGYYEVSDMGRVRSVDRMITERSGLSRPARGRILKIMINTHGYPCVSLSRNDQRKCVVVHRLVMLAFVGPPPAGHEVRHRDRTRANVRLTNLRYGTSADNSADSIADGTMRNGQTNKARCSRFGHMLVGPNLVRGDLPYRACRSCAYSRSTLWNDKVAGKPPRDTAEEIANTRYRTLMQGIDPLLDDDDRKD